MELNDILEGKEQEPAQQDEPAPEPTAEEPKAEASEAPKGDEPAKDEGQTRNEKGQFQTKGEEKPKADPEEGSPPEPQKSEKESDEPNEVTGLKAATAAERQKRQAAEQRAATLEAELQQLRNPQGKDFQSDPEGYLATREMSLRTELSREVMLANHDDYEDVEQVFAEEAQANPALIAGLKAAPNPARYAYDQGKKIQALRDIGDPSEYRTKVRQELEAEIRKELEAKLREEQPQRKPTPSPSLAGAASASGGVNNPGWQGPRSLDSIIQ